MRILTLLMTLSIPIIGLAQDEAYSIYDQLLEVEGIQAHYELPNYLKQHPELEHIVPEHFVTIMHKREQSDLKMRMDTLTYDRVFIVSRLYDYDSSFATYEEYYQNSDTGFVLVHTHNPNHQYYDLDETGVLGEKEFFRVDVPDKKYRIGNDGGTRASDKALAKAFRKNILASYRIYAMIEGDQIISLFEAPAEPGTKIKITVETIPTSF